MRDKDFTKKEIADYCESVYRNESLTVRQVTDRLGSMIKRHLKHRDIGIESSRVRVGQHSEVHYRFTNINEKLNDDDRKKAEVKEAHRISNKLREWKDAIISLNLPHHLIEKNLDKANKNLAEYIPEFSKSMSPDMDINDLRNNWKVIYKNERRGPNRAAVVKALQDIRFEHHAYYLLQPIYVWVRKIATSLDSEKRDNNVMSQIKINPNFALETAEQLIKDSIEKKLNASKFDLAIGIAIATGRRRTEIFKTAIFDAIETTPEGHVVFSGQLKTHDRALFDDLKPYVIPCLIDRNLVISGLELLRELQCDDVVSYLDKRGNEVKHGVLEMPLSDQYHTNAVGKFYSHAANDRIRSLFGTPAMEFRHSRDMYSEIGYDKYKKEGEGRSSFRTRVYGHAKGQSETGRAYEKFEISTDVEKASFIRTNETKVESSQNKPVVDVLKELTPKIEAWLRSPNAIRIHNWLVTQLEAGLPVENITAHYIRKHIMLPDVQQLNLRSIQTYLSDKWANWEENKLLALEQAAEDEGLDDIDDEIDMIESEEDQPAEDEVPGKEDATNEDKIPAEKNNKPRFSVPHKNDDGTWKVEFVIDDKKYTEMVEDAENMQDAGAQAWQQWQIRQDLPNAMPSPVILKQKSGWWLAQIKYKGNILAEAMTKSKLSARQAVETEYKQNYKN